mmetsp:Transcript_8264/g.23213  ORF Transcript_8264/g.23213 Transcript_8264/m.23213 type:complete len:773 (-) Transcript_8264:115-2433(-)
MADEMCLGSDPNGSGWEAFTGVDAYGQEVSVLSPVDALLLHSPPCSIEELLDEEGLVQEFRCGNSQLLERLCTTEALLTLVRYVTQEPPDDVPEASRCRRPYTASELLASGSEGLCEALVHSGPGDELLGRFWGFLDAPEASLASPALAGYFCSAAVALLAARPGEVAAFLRGRGPEKLLESLLGLLELRCCAELIALLLAAETPSHMVFPTSGLVRQLVARLDRSGPASAVPEHAAFLLDHLLAKACVGDLCYGGELLQQLAEPEIVILLVDKVLAGSAAAASVLSSAVSHLHLLPAHPLLPVKSPELRSPCTPHSPGPRVAPPQRPPAPLGDRDPDIEAGTENESPPGAAAPSAGDGEDAGSLDMSALGGPAQLSMAGAALVAELCIQLPRLCQALEGATSQRVEAANAAHLEAARAQATHEAIVLLLQGGGGGSDDKADVGPLVARLSELCNKPEAQELRDSLERHGWSVSGPQVPQSINDLQDVLADLRRTAQFARANAAQAPPASGGIAVEILCLLTLLVKTGRSGVLEAMLAAEALPRCLEMLVVSASSSLLHSAVRAVFTEVLSDRTAGVQLVLALLQAAPLMQRVVAEQRLAIEVNEASVDDKCRRSQIGYMGPLRCICADLSSLSGDSPQIASALERIEGWSETVLPGIESAEQLYSEPLGGTHPDAGSTAMPSFNCIMAMHGAMAEQSDEIDLSLEDLRDINEDLDVQQMLNRAERQMLDKADLTTRRRAQEALDAPTTEEAANGQPTSEGQALVLDSVDLR